MKQSNLPSVFRAFTCLLFLSSLPARAELSGQLRVHLGTGFDSNARRDFFQPTTPPQGDALVSGIVSGELGWQTPHFFGQAAYDIGGRKFLVQSPEDTVIQAAQWEGGTLVLQRLQAGLLGRARDRRGADRDYTDVSVRGFFTFTPDDRVLLRVEAGPHRFWFTPRPEYGFFAGEWAVSARYRFNARHSLTAFFDQGTRNHDGLNRPNPLDPQPPPGRPRIDEALTAGAAYHFRGRFLASVQYVFNEVASNSFGETVLRHRVTGTLGLRLPWKMTVLASGTLQLSLLPDGIFLAQDLNILEDEESHNTVSLKWVRPLSSSVELEARLALFQNQLPQNQLFYLRQLAQVGLTFRY